MYYLYPRLPIPLAEKIAMERSSLSIKDLIYTSDIQHNGTTIAPIGGHKVNSSNIEKLQEKIRICARESGYPRIQRNEGALRSFDYNCSILLYETMHLHPSEASHLEIWAFISCILVPDVVRWRFPGESTNVERFIGSDRGLRRNTFGRLWWRAYLLRKPLEPQPFNLLHELVEDDLVQITERNSIAASSTFLIMFCNAYVESLQYYSVPRRLLMRESSKRVRRLLSIISFDALDALQVKGFINNVFSDTAKSLEGYRGK